MAHELDARMRAQEVGFGKLTQAVEDYTVQTTLLVTKHDKSLYGTPTTPGIEVRLDREEQKSKTITRAVWIVATAAMGLGMTYAATAIF